MAVSFSPAVELDLLKNSQLVSQVYPVCLNITGKLCVVVGGGDVAERKVNGLLIEKARVRVISPEVTTRLAELTARRECEWRQKAYATGDLDGAFLVFAATDSSDVQQQIFRDADSQGVLVNVIDSPEQCSFQVPATVQRGDLTLAVSTAGKSPAVAAMVRRHLDDQYGWEYAQLLQLMGELRGKVIAVGDTSAERKILFQNILHDDIIEWIRAGRWDRVQNHLQEVLGPDMDFDISQLGPGA